MIFQLHIAQFIGVILMGRIFCLFKLKKFHKLRSFPSKNKKGIGIHLDISRGTSHTRAHTHTQKGNLILNNYGPFMRKQDLLNHIHT